LLLIVFDVGLALVPTDTDFMANLARVGDVFESVLSFLHEDGVVVCLVPYQTPALAFQVQSFIEEKYSNQVHLVKRVFVGEPVVRSILDLRMTSPQILSTF
jgi:hypothetical protein